MPLLAYRPENPFIALKFWTWSVAVEFGDEYDDEPRNIRNLIERLRKLGESPRPIDGLRAVVLAAALSDRLNELSDRQIGQLLFDFCWPECYFNSPELIIVTQAIAPAKALAFYVAKKGARLEDLSVPAK